MAEKDMVAEESVEAGEDVEAEEDTGAGNNVYRRLQQHIDNMPVGFPATASGVEIRLLKHLFSEKEAEMALYLSALPEPLDKIHARAQRDGIGRRELGVCLARLARKGAILKSEVKGQPAFSKAMLAIGMFEFQVNRLSKEYHSDIMQYMEEEFAEAFFTKNTSQMRTIPINEEILPERSIGNYDGAKKLVMESEGPFAVINCVCRQGMDLQGEPCRLSDIRETCLLLGGAAKGVIHSGAGRELSREETVGILERADEVGMVLQPQNTQNPHFICCCCGCCCGVLVSVKKLPRPAEYFDANYFAEVHGDLCVECGTCRDRCAMDAITYSDGIAVVDEFRCIGCGLCVSTCPHWAITLSERAEVKTPPRSERALYMKILQERFGPLGTAKIAAKKALGLKI